MFVRSSFLDFIRNSLSPCSVCTIIRLKMKNAVVCTSTEHICMFGSIVSHLLNETVSFPFLSRFSSAF